MAAETPEVFDFLLNCQICLEPFDQKLRIPRILPCYHTFCSPCIAKLDRGGNLTCPNDRSEIPVSGPFPVDFTRAAVVEHKDLLRRKGGPSFPLEEACPKHQDEKLKFFCTTCKRALCSECAFIEHGNKTGHKFMKLGDILEQVKREVTADLSDFMKTLPAVGTIVSVTSQSSDIPTTASMTSSTILTPKFPLELGRCRAGCTLMEDGRTLSNKPRPQSDENTRSGVSRLFELFQSCPRPFAFLGTCGSVDLAQPALHYWTVRCWAGSPGFGARCEFGLASLQTLDTCSGGQRIFDHDVNSATLVMFLNRKTMRLVGSNWTKDMDTPPSPQGRDVTYMCLWEKEISDYLDCDMTLGFLYDNRQPQSPRVLVVEADSCRLLGVRRLSPSPPLRPVLRLWPTCIAWGSADAWLEVETGPGILSDITATQLQSLL